MKTAEILERVAEDGLTLSVSPDGNIDIVGDEDTVDNWIEAIRENKAANLSELSRQPVHGSWPSKYSVTVADASADPVVATVVIRGLGSIDLEIPKDRFDGMAILELLERHNIEWLH